MIDELRARKLLFVLGANAGVMIVLLEIISPGKVATLEQQFGEGTDEQDLLEPLDVLTPSMLQHGHEMEQAVVNKSAATLHQEVTWLSKQIFMWPGVRVKEQEGGCERQQRGTIFGQLLLDGKWLPTESEAVHPSINMESLLRHPAMRDWRKNDS
jgi:hypothetical protein